MMLNGGEYGGKRLLATKTVRDMTSDHVTESDEDGYGFGVGVNRKEWDGGSVGAYGWAGGLSTRFSVDPDKKLITIFMSQLDDPSDLNLVQRFQVLAHQKRLRGPESWFGRGFVVQIHLYRARRMTRWHDGDAAYLRGINAISVWLFELEGFESLYHDHGAATERAEPSSSFTRLARYERKRGVSVARQQLLTKRQQLSQLARREEAEEADAHEVGQQHVLEGPPEELFRGERHQPTLAAVSVVFAQIESSAFVKGD